MTRDEVLAVFQNRVQPHEPLGTSEVAEAVDAARRTVYDKLERLVEEGRLESKMVGARARVWWLPTATGTPNAPSEDAASLLELTSEHVRELEFESDVVAEMMRPLAGDEFHTAIEGIVPLGERGQLEYWVVRGIEPSTYFEVLDGFPTVREYRLLSRYADEYRIEVKVTADSLMGIFARFEGRLARATIDADGLSMVGEFPATVDVDEVVAAGRQSIPDLRLVSQQLVYTPRLFRHLVVDDLTDRQWTALQAAYYGGYFNWPRDSTGDELAGHLGVTRQTFHHHLRHAEAGLCRNLFEGVDHDGGDESYQ